MSRFIQCSTHPTFHATSADSNEGYLCVSLKCVKQLRIQDRLVHGSKRNADSAYIRSGTDLELFATTLFQRTGYTVVNFNTDDPVIPGKFDASKVVSYHPFAASDSLIEQIGKMKSLGKIRRYCQPGEKLPIAKNPKFKFYSDPGHGWLAVSMDLIFALGLETKISPFSYRNGEMAYLEEDGDAYMFIDALIERGVPFDAKINTQSVCLQSSSDNNYIRRQMPFYV